MRNILFFIGFLGFTIIELHGQVEIEKEEKFKILNNYELATGKNHDTKSLLKLTRDGGFNNNLTHSYEYKLNGNISLAASLRGERYTTFIFETPQQPTFDTISGFQPIPVFTGQTQTRLRVEASLEGRYYVNQTDLIAQGFGNNVNGLYATAGIGSKLYEGGEEINNRFFTYMGVGVQSRILKYGILDFRILATYRNERFRIAPKINAGFAMSKNYKNLEFDNARCNILKCFEERNYQFKIPLNNAISLAYTPEFQHVFATLSPRVKFEHRLFKGFSFNHSASYSNNWNLNFRGETNVLPSGGVVGYNNNLRWYILKSRNIASGKSADNLSGMYAETLIGLSWARIIYPDWGNIENTILAYKTRTTSLGMSVGYQTRLFKRLYVDIKAFYRDHARDVTFTNESILIPVPGPDNWTRYGLSMEFGFLF